MNPLLAQFLAEARELLQGIDEKLLRLEKNPGDPPLMDDLFRTVHTLKGNSGLFEFPEMTRVLHGAEDLMDAVRSGRLPFSRDLADGLLEAMDFVLILCQDLEAEKPVDADRARAAQALTQDLRRRMPAAPEGPGPAAAGPASIAPGTPPPLPAGAPTWADLPPALGPQARQDARAGRPWKALRYRPEAQCFFHGVDPFHLARGTPDRLWGRIAPRGPFADLAALDAYRCDLDFWVVTRATADELNDHFRYVADQVEAFELPPAPADPTRAAARRGLEAQVLATQKTILELADETPWRPGRWRAVASVLGALAEGRGDGEGRVLAAGALDAALASSSPEPLLDRLAVLEGRRPPETPAPRVGARAEAPPAEAEAGGADPGRFQHRQDDGGAGASRTLRVDHAKIDALMNLIGEMVVAKNALPYLAKKTEEVWGNRDLAREIKGHYAVLHRITSEMQDAILQVRMLPMSFVFQRFPRLVREIARKLGKEVDLVLEGEETEADKNIISALSDPLIHIVRNSLDHGLETPEARRAAGKPVQGRLTIRAGQEADRVVIEISDDGRGINPAAVKAKALERGLIDQVTHDRMADRDAVQLVFAPGLSTAAVVSDLSGRGVGMDVVKAAVEGVNGSLDLESTPGQGTRIKLSLPLSMAMTSVMVVEADGQAFGVPLDQVVETLRVPRTGVKTIKRHRSAVLRGRLVPLKALTEVLGLGGQARTNGDDEWSVLVTRVGSGVIGLLVDRFQGTTDIIQKPLEGVLAPLTAYSGSALLGDGSVLMVLNLKEVV